MRTVEVSNYTPKGLTILGHAIFHQFGVDYKWINDDMVVNYSTAIVEFEDGRVMSVPADHIRFINDKDLKCNQASTKN